MKRLSLIAVVALLVLSASGLLSISFADPCETSSADSGGDQSCPPNCFTCGCCAQAMVPVTVQILANAEEAVPFVAMAPLPTASGEPHGILHVPKRSV
ncbi:MAG: hypothetical protein ABI672_00240 [Vicinamibacteria bacterium]